MKSIVAFVDLTRNPDEFLERVSKHLSMGDALFFVHELPSVEGALLPLIGDLKEIRRAKIVKQLHELKDQLNTPLCRFEPIVFEETLVMNGAMETLNQGEVVIADQNQELVNLDKPRFSKWIHDLKKPVYTLNLSDQIVPLKR
jgi:hypothetical protein